MKMVAPIVVPHMCGRALHREGFYINIARRLQFGIARIGHLRFRQTKV